MPEINDWVDDESPDTLMPPRKPDDYSDGLTAAVTGQPEINDWQDDGLQPLPELANKQPPAKPSELSKLGRYASMAATNVPKLLYTQIKELSDPTSISRTVLDQGLQGTTFAGADEITDRLGAMGASIYTGEKYKDVLKDARSASKQRMAQQAEQNPVTAIGSNIAGALLTGGAGASTKAGTAIGNSLRTGNIAARIGKGALAGAASGAAYGAGNADDGEGLAGAGKGLLVGGSVGAALPAVAGLYGAVKGAILPKASEGIIESAKLAEKHGIPLSLDQISNSKARKYLADTSSRIPFSGAPGFAESQQKQWNRAVLKTVGIDADSVNPQVAQTAYDTIGKKFDDVLAGKTVTVTDRDMERFSKIIEDSRKSIGNEKTRVVQDNIMELLDNLDGNTISGKKIGDFRSTITKRLRNAEPGVKQALAKVVDQIVDISTKGTPGAKEALKEARYQWKNLKTLEPLLAKATDGNISPALLKGAVSKSTSYGAKNMATGKAGDLGELARVGDLIKKKIGDSGTAERLASYALYSSPGAIYGAATSPDNRVGGAAVGALGTLALAKGYQSYNNSPYLVNKALQPALRGLLTKSSVPAINGINAGLLTPRR